MDLDLATIKQRLQKHFTDGLVTIVGSGLSVAEGIPGTEEVAVYLQAEVPSRLREGSEQRWDEIAAELGRGTDLENTMLKFAPDHQLEQLIVELTAELILESERSIIEEVVEANRTLRFSRILSHMLKPNSGIPVITTNYDRLIEVAAEAVGLAVDTLFVGHHLGHLNPKESQFSFCRGIKKFRTSVHLTYADRLILLKPHGSLDWYLQDDDPIRCPLPLSHQRLMITPGLNKFRGGYDRPFDAHRERANREIDRAARYLILGYGFNDDHLQTHLEPELRKGKPTVVLTRTLSAKAKTLLAEARQVMAISADEGHDGALISTQGKSTFFAGANLWDLEVFVREVLEP